MGWLPCVPHSALYSDSPTVMRLPVLLLAQWCPQRQSANKVCFGDQMTSEEASVKLMEVFLCGSPFHSMLRSGLFVYFVPEVWGQGSVGNLEVFLWIHDVQCRAIVLKLLPFLLHAKLCKQYSFCLVAFCAPQKWGVLETAVIQIRTYRISTECKLFQCSREVCRW